jgi:hypothetical protein
LLRDRKQLGMGLVGIGMSVDVGKGSGRIGRVGCPLTIWLLRKEWQIMQARLQGQG